MLEGEASNVRQASFSQPLCCVVQIVLVRLLSAAGIHFNAVVGHSSGEVARAFATGFISAAQAIRIAYLHGVVSAEHASSTSGQPGAMLVAGMSYEDAKELCEMEVFEGRVCVAASNSPDRVTISGDADAIQHVCWRNAIAPLPDANPTQTGLVWYSSVQEHNKEMTAEDVTAAYWKDNLMSPFLFSHAVQKAAVTCRGLQVGLEVGCHPALKGPCLAAVKDTLDGKQLPYTGCLERGADDMAAFARGLGYLWERFGVPTVNATGFAKEVSPQRPFQSLAKWKNFVRSRDLEWLDGHALQGQTVFPAAGCIVMAMEAAMRVANDNNYEVELLGIVDMDISKAVVFQDDNSLVELNLSASVTGEPGQDGITTHKFFIDLCLSKESEILTSAKGEIIMAVADKSSLPAGDDESVLLAPEKEHPQMNRVNIDSFYKELDLMGYEYSKDFRCLKTMRRADAKATGTLAFLKFVVYFLIKSFLQSMDVIEIGAGTGGATKHILSRPQLGLNSYTYTDISTDFFQQARVKFAEFDTGEPMQFESLDIRWSRAGEGFKDHPYDLIIASNVLHATPKLEETMTLEITHREHSRLGFLFGLFPDCRTFDGDANLFPTSVFSTIVVVGGKFPETRRITEELTSILPQRSVQSFTSLNELASADQQLKSTFVAVKNLLFLARKMLWLTESAWINNPHQASTIGMLRSIAREHPEGRYHDRNNLDGASVAALSEQNASMVHISQNDVFAAPSNVADKAPGEFLMSVAATLMGEAVSRQAQDSGPAASILVFEPPSFCIRILLEEAERRDFQICFATTWSSFKSTSSPASSAR
ncbi:Lovastatin nonaketide synthase mokA [Colletotrichum gloeosporioides]|uniref:Lovastatin nonaketide synthase mokA n=1 Tax=Colletotrichum gloeosporioides TaxID=474922 RepID=A0A8H4C8J9_COLGL|nr:Lovastatin nonaketide synthase mokA [Colletotrichum gloeosporioides]KAF3799137.1 Lovastatin nonaketide synthase mokA [Colletotrichum gloeosporioides]